MWAVRCIQDYFFLLLLLTGMARELCTAFSLLVWQHVGTEMHTERFLPVLLLLSGTRPVYSLPFVPAVATSGH